MQERILSLAAEICRAGEEDQPLLELLCVAAENFWTARLRDNVDTQTCQEAFLCAAAFTAAADFLSGSSAVMEAASFTAGEVTVKAKSAAEAKENTRQLRQAANRLMEPYVRPETFWFAGVRG